MSALEMLGITVAISELPSEIPGAIPFSRDQTHAAYDADYARRFFRVLVQVDRVFKQFRTGFVGKSSPVHFFWGSSIWRSRVFRAGAPRCIRAAFPVSPMRLCVRPIPTRSAAPGSGRADPASTTRRFIPRPILHRTALERPRSNRQRRPSAKPLANFSCHTTPCGPRRTLIKPSLPFSTAPMRQRLERANGTGPRLKVRPAFRVSRGRLDDRAVPVAAMHEAPAAFTTPRAG
jgi:hypothetical protein